MTNGKRFADGAKTQGRRGIYSLSPTTENVSEVGDIWYI